MRYNAMTAGASVVGDVMDTVSLPLPFAAGIRGGVLLDGSLHFASTLAKYDIYILKNGINTISLKMC